MPRLAGTVLFLQATGERHEAGERVARARVR